MKKIGFLSFGFWDPRPGSAVRSARDALEQSIELAVAAEELGADGAYYRVHHFARQITSPFALLSAVAARTSRIEIGTGVIDMRYENPLYMAELAATADLISGGRLHLGLSRGSGEQVLEGWRHFGFEPGPGRNGEDLGRSHAERLMELLEGNGFAEPNPRPMFPNPPGALRLEPVSEGLRDRIYWGNATDATARWAANLGMNFQGGPLKSDETGEPFHVQQRRSIEVFRDAWREAGHEREPRITVARTIYPLLDDRDRSYFGGQAHPDAPMQLAPGKMGIKGRTFAATPDLLVRQLAEDEALAVADTVLLTIPSMLGVDYNARLIDAIIRHVAPGLGWR